MSGSVSFRLEKSLIHLIPRTRWAPTIVINGVFTFVNGLIYKWVTVVISPLQVRALLLIAFPGPTGRNAFILSTSFQDDHVLKIEIS